MKRIFAAGIFALLVVMAVSVVFGAGEVEEEPVTDVFRRVPGEYPYVMVQRDSSYKLEDAVDDANDIVAATLRRLRVNEDYPTVELDFYIRESYRGESRGTITVEVQPQFSTVEDGVPYGRMHNYVEGHDYLLVLERTRSVYSEGDKYRIASDIFIPLDYDVGEYMDGKDVVGQVRDPSAMREAGSTAEYVILMCDTLPEGYEPFSWWSTPFTESTKLEEIVEASEYAVIVKAHGSFYDAKYRPTETRFCDVLEVLKAKAKVPEEIMVTFLVDTVEEDGEYLLLLNRPGDTSNIFGMSSRASVIPLSDARKVERVRELLGG